MAVVVVVAEDIPVAFITSLKNDSLVVFTPGTGVAWPLCLVNGASSTVDVAILSIVFTSVLSSDLVAESPFCFSLSLTK